MISVFIAKDLVWIDRIRVVEWEDWAKENNIKFHLFRTADPSYFMIYFRNEEDALIFKLKFGYVHR